jgi:hypothetical protein
MLQAKGGFPKAGSAAAMNLCTACCLMRQSVVSHPAVLYWVAVL